MAQSGDDRLPVFRQEFHRRHLWESTILAEDQWAHDGPKLISRTQLISKQLLEYGQALPVPIFECSVIRSVDAF
jgi:hypothetical protein